MIIHITVKIGNIIFQYLKCLNELARMHCMLCGVAYLLTCFNFDLRTYKE